VQAPIDRVAAFHGDTKTLKLLTPPPIIVSFNKVEPLAENSSADFTMWLGPIPVHWVAIHSDVHPHNGFTDTQAQGPFKTWVHRHTFKAVSPERTEISDEIDAQTGDHILWGLISRFMWLSLPILFAYRTWRTRKELEQ
jgi:ligand-binding SRPBCC domain-containing protein